MHRQEKNQLAVVLLSRSDSGKMNLLGNQKMLKVVYIYNQRKADLGAANGPKDPNLYEHLRPMSKFWNAIFFLKMDVSLKPTYVYRATEANNMVMPPENLAKLKQGEQFSSRPNFFQKFTLAKRFFPRPIRMPRAVVIQFIEVKGA